MTLVPVISSEQFAALREAILAGEGLLDYSSLAVRLRVEESTVRAYVSARIIRPCLKRGRVVRFHWPSVVAQLSKSL